MKVLVVDDSEPVRLLLVRWLATLGHEPVAAGSAKEALTQLETSSFDAVLTDLVMPDASGWEVIAAARARRAEVPVVVMTGWDDGTPGREGLVPDDLLEKPFSIDRVREVLAAIEARKGT